jgi:hypothetical protein
MAKVYDLQVQGLNELLRDFRKLGKDADKELRDASGRIAGNIMAPSWRDAALTYAGPWGQAIADSIKVRRDRLPAINIGGNRRVFSGGATATMVRYPSDKGNRARAAKGARNRMPAAFGDGSDWIEQATGYQDRAIREWSQAVDLLIAKWILT